MSIFPLICLLLCFSCAGYSITITPADAHRVAQLIWRNECGGTVEGLTHWNKGEEFASLGIGHFIWYPADKHDRFQETFPALIEFLKKQDVIVPTWLRDAKGCPWTSREDFFAQFASEQMIELRHWLFETRDLQAIYIAQRLEQSIPQGLYEPLLIRLASDPNGLYALIDYSNFKGIGTSESEQYQGKGWGLVQVLEGIPTDTLDPIGEFVGSAKRVLKQRVDNSPSERDERRWLEGWLKRIDSYAANTSIEIEDED